MVGYDSEFYGVDIRTQSCVGRAKVDVFSLATPSGPVTPLGFNKPESWVFNGELLTYGPIKSFLESGRVTKPIHNQPVDAHAAANHGVFIQGGVNTLAMARWIYPERAALPGRNFDLDALCRWKIGFGKTEEFDELFGYDESVPYEAVAEKNWCLACADFGCKKKKAPHDAKERRETPVIRHKQVRRHTPLHTVRPGHPLWDRYRIYAAVDAELALILYQIMLRDGRAEREYPWCTL